MFTFPGSMGKFKKNAFFCYEYVDCATGLTTIARVSVAEYLSLGLHDYLWAHDGSAFVKSYNDGLNAGAPTSPTPCLVMMSSAPANCAGTTYAAFNDAHDDNSYDTCRNSATTSGAGTLTEQNGVLEHRYSGDVYNQAKNSIPLIMAGDFDIKMSFTNLDIKYYNGTDSSDSSYGDLILGFSIGATSYTITYYKRYDSGKIPLGLTYNEGVFLYSGALSAEAGLTLPSSGYLRVARVGSTMTFYYGATALGTESNSGDVTSINYNLAGRARPGDGTTTVDTTTIEFTGG